MRYFCTYFDHNYLPFAVALHASLTKHCSPFRLFVLALDDRCAGILRSLDLPGTSVVLLRDLEETDCELAGSKQTRSRIEYYYTCGPAFLQYCLERFPEIDLLTLIDADLYFFSNPEPIFRELADASVGIIEHRFSEKQYALKRFGTYNVGWTSFRRDVNGLACLR